MSIKEIPLIIGGERVRSKSEHWLDVLNPATQEVVAKVPMATPDEVAAAVASAKEAFKTWSKTPKSKRAEYTYFIQNFVIFHPKKKYRKKIDILRMKRRL